MFLYSLAAFSLFLSPIAQDEPILIWPELAPNETSRQTGTQQPFRTNESPPVVRVEKITLPTMTYHPAPESNGSAVVILPGGGFGKVVTNKEGTELASILNRVGVSCFVLSYRTRSKTDANGWSKPLQDAQRALSMVRANSRKWKIDHKRIGLVGFSAGGNVAARLLCDRGIKAYVGIDAVDNTSHRPDFALLIYPWNIFDNNKKALVDGLKVPQDCPPTFLLHTNDDRSSSLGPIEFYTQLKLQKIPAELHVYSKGGHGYGTREVRGSQVHHWTKMATDWLKTLK